MCSIMWHDVPLCSQFTIWWVLLSFDTGHVDQCPSELFHCMMTSSMETFSALLALCEGNSPVTSEFHSQGPLMWSFDVSFDLHLHKWLSKPLRCQWFETASCSLWHHCNGDCANPTTATVPVKQPRCIWANTLQEYTKNDIITKSKKCTTKPSAYFMRYTVDNTYVKAPVHNFNIKTNFPDTGIPIIDIRWSKDCHMKLDTNRFYLPVK